MLNVQYRLNPGRIGFKQVRREGQFCVAGLFGKQAQLIGTRDVIFCTGNVQLGTRLSVIEDQEDIAGIDMVANDGLAVLGEQCLQASNLCMSN